MYRNYRYDTINNALPHLFGALLQDGIDVGSRNGRTMELPFTGITLEDGTAREILLPGRKHNLAAQIAETMWVLSGRNDIEWLSHYLPRAKDFSDNGVVWRGGYGPRIRNWVVNDDGDTIDQMAHVVDLLRMSPGTRQAVVSIYDPMIDTQPGLDIPCNDFLHFLSRSGKLDLHIFVRSNDAMWGWSGINVFEWSSLLEVVAGMVGLDVGALHFSVSSFHVYEQHWAKARKIADMGTVSQYPESPRFDPTGLDGMDSFHELTHLWFQAEAAIRKQAALPTSERNLWDLIEDFPEPMLQSWLRVLAWWWTGELHYLAPLAGTNLAASAATALQPGVPRLQTDDSNEYPAEDPLSLIEKIIALHNEKDAAYGDSWCKRGEMLGIMANIARKVDRIESGKVTSDETMLDTAMDLLVYVCKYRAWIDNSGVPSVVLANEALRTVADLGPVTLDVAEVTDSIPGAFAGLEMAVVHKGNREAALEDLAELAWALVSGLAAK